MNLKTNRKGFTIVELLIVIVVIAILAAISIVAYTGIQDRARNSSAFSLASQVAKKAEIYYAINGSYPTVAANFTSEAALEGLKVTIGSTGVLVTPPVVFGNFGATGPANTNSLAQYNSGTRVIYVASATAYSVLYRTGTATFSSITKGTPPAGIYVWVSNENI